IALVQHDLDARIARRELDNHLRQNVARLCMGSGDCERARVLAFVLRPDAFEIFDLPKRATGGRDDSVTGGCERGESLSVAHEDRDAEFVLELTNLLADSR